MPMLRRMFVSFVVLLNVLGFFLIFVVIANGTTEHHLTYIAESDARVVSVIAAFGCLANIGLGYVLIKRGIRTRRIEADLRDQGRPRITGE